MIGSLLPGFEIRNISKGFFGLLPLKLRGSTVVFKDLKTTTSPVHVDNYLHTRLNSSKKSQSSSVVKLGCFMTVIPWWNSKSSTKYTVPVQIFVGSRDPYDGKVERSYLLTRVFEVRALLISNPDTVVWNYYLMTFWPKMSYFISQKSWKPSANNLMCLMIKIIRFNSF